MVSDSISDTGLPFFLDVHKERGLTFTQQNGSLEKTILYEAKGAGVSVADVNQDGWDDIYFCNGTSNLSGHPAPQNQFFLNQKDGTFRDYTQESGLGISGQSVSAVFGDYDNDGDLDVYVCKVGDNQLLQNTGNGTFVDVSIKANVVSSGMSTAAAWGDVNGDGYPDLFVCNYADISTEIVQAFGGMTSLLGQDVFLGPLTFHPQDDVLFINQKNGSFADETSLRGIQTWEEGRGLGVVMLDIEKDGDIDIFTGNDMTSDSMYINDGTGHFNEQALLIGLGYNGNGQALATMGIAVNDFDLDQDQDILLAGYEGEINTLFRNEDGMFVDITTFSNAGDKTKPYVTFGALFGDWNNDGFRDIFYANGHVYPQMDGVANHVGYAQPNQILLHNQNHTFKDVSESCGPGLKIHAVSRGAAKADFNRDGKLDLIVNNLDGTPSLLENQTARTGHWLQIKAATKTGMPAYGSVIEVHTNKRVLQQVLCSTDSFCSQSSAWLHFGLGEEDIKTIQIQWLNGKKEEIHFSSVNKRITVIQQENGASKIKHVP